MKILFIASECWPLVKVGGLADVVGSLSRALKKRGLDVSVALPFYRKVKPENPVTPLKKKFCLSSGNKKEPFSLYKTFLFEEEVPVYLIKKEKYFKEEVYRRSDGRPARDIREAKRFLFLCRAGLEIAAWKKADIIHCHDWQTALVPFVVKKRDLSFKTLLTVHNLGYQGVYPGKEVEKRLGLEFRSQDLNFLRLGIENADLVNTVSPTYAKEILSKRFGCGLEKTLRKRKKDLSGIVNGLDLEAWNPEKDPWLARNYSSLSLEKKKENKKFLLKKYFNSSRLSPPLLGLVSRLAVQKGISLVQKVLPRLIKEDLYFILLGQGLKKYEEYFARFSEKHGDRFQAVLGFDKKLAHRIYGGADMFLIPSFYEPCGLGQQIAMRYGTVPLGRATGGIKDTVSRTRSFLFWKKVGTGFLFKRPRGEALLKTIEKALRVYRKRKGLWVRIQKKGMKKDFSWEKSAGKYIDLYREISLSR